MQIKIQNVGFCYGENRVLEDVSLTINGGEIIALLGENGAGKSTLMNLLGGVLTLSEGKITIDGSDVSFSSPSDSLKAGIGFIHQELNLIDNLTVYENMFISSFPKKGPFLDKKSMIKKTEELFNSLNIDINPKSLVGDLDVSYKQITEICRALLQDAKVIIMDEPTTSLNEEEIERVFSIMRTLKDKGVAMIFISHKLNEVMEICDRYAVLRNGVLVEEGNVSDTDIIHISEALVGHSISKTTRRINVKYGKEVLRIEKFGNGKDFKDITLSVKEGQILGVTGLLGDGRSEIFQTIFGAKGKNHTGKIYYLGEEYKIASTTKSIKNKIAYIPPNRKENAIIKDMSILDNITIASLSDFLKFGFLQNKLRLKAFTRYKKALSIKANNPARPITSLSGGNQQKVVLAKWLMTGPKLLILDNPTQGVDVGAKAEIYSFIKNAAELGAAVIILSPEAQEIVSNCESAYVLFHGKTAAYLEGDELSETLIMNYATGGK